MFSASFDILKSYKTSRQTFPYATVDAAISRKKGWLLPGAAMHIGFDPSVFSADRVGKTHGEVFVNTIPYNEGRYKDKHIYKLMIFAKYIPYYSNEAYGKFFSIFVQCRISSSGPTIPKNSLF